MSNYHAFLTEDQKHDPKGFIPAINNTFPVKDELGLSFYEERMSLPKAISFVDGTVAAPTTVDGDIYVIIGTGVVDVSWGGAAFGDWVRFTSSIGNNIVPVAGYLCYDIAAASWKEYDGSAWATFGGGGADVNLGDNDLILQGTALRTYNISGQTLAFINGADTKLKVFSTGVSVLSSTIPSGASFFSKGIGNTSGTTSLKAESLNASNSLTYKDDGNLDLISTGGTNIKISTTVSTGAVGSTYFLNGVQSARIAAYSTGTSGIFVNSLMLESKVGGVLSKGLSTAKWIVDGGGADANVAMRLSTAGLMLGVGIGAATQLADYHLRGHATTGDNLLLEDSNGVKRLSFSNDGQLDCTSSSTGQQQHNLGNLNTAQSGVLNFKNNVGTVGRVIVGGATLAAGTQPLLVGAISYQSSGSATRMLIADGSGGGMYFLTSNTVTDGNTDMKLTTAGLVIGDGVGDVSSFPIPEQLSLYGRAFLANQTEPATPTGGGVTYVEAGAYKYKGSSGTVTILGVA